MNRLMSSWKYAPVAESEEAPSRSKRSCWQRTKDIINSRTFGRTLAILIAVLLLANLFKPGQEVLRKYGWLTQETNDDGSSLGSEILDKPVPTDGSVDWRQYAYCQYVTTEDYLCNSLMIFERLVALKAKAERLMLYPEEWIVGGDSETGRLLAKARDDYGVRLVPIHVQRFAGEPTWAESFTKLLAFNQTQYKRVLSLDSDATVLKPMDELFLLPSAPVGMPRAYWIHDTLSSQLVLVEPSDFEFNRIQDAFATRAGSDFDMEIVNNLYGKSCFIIPHRKYDLLTGEFKAGEHEHERYLGSKEEKWDTDRVLKEAKFLHFSDWPYPKPWIQTDPGTTEANKPKCRGGDCRDQKAWLGFYSDFRDRRAKVCGSSFVRLAKREELDALPRSRFEPVFR